ncbi:MAG: DUF4199 domain-containing protein [Bacteroidota bacterium]
MNETIKKNGITFGILSGVVTVLITTLIYVIDINLFGSWWVGLLGISISIIIACVLLSKTKKELNGVFSFKEAFTTYFIMAVIGILISTTFSIILFNFIDPSLKDTIKELTIKNVVSMMEKFGGRPKDINEAIKGIQESDQFSIGSQIKGIFSSLVVSSIFGLILAAFFKTKPNNEF